MIRLSRRATLLSITAGIGVGAGWSSRVIAAQSEAQEISWDDLIPEGVPYAEIIADGEYDEASDIWRPVFDKNGIRMNTKLDGKTIKLPGYIVPLDTSSDGLSEFILAPYMGACIHVPPPPPNQIIFVNSKTPWPADRQWEPIWVTGVLSVNLQDSGIAETGYEITADRIETYEW